MKLTLTDKYIEQKRNKFICYHFITYTLKHGRQKHLEYYSQIFR